MLTHIMRNRLFYFFLIACASSLAGHSDAINYAERAESQLKKPGKTINQSLSNWLLGYFIMGRRAK